MLGDSAVLQTGTQYVDFRVDEFFLAHDMLEAEERVECLFSPTVHIVVDGTVGRLRECKMSDLAIVIISLLQTGHRVKGVQKVGV